MAILTFQNIMDADDITENDVSVEEWGGEVRVRSISHRKMREIKKRAKENEVTDDFIEQQVMLEGLVSPSLTEEEIEHLWDKNTQAVMKVLNGILSGSKTQEKAVKEQEKSIPPESE